MESEVFREGCDACLKNAELWLNEGSLLLKNGSYGHAYALFVHGLEGLMHAFLTWQVYIGALKPDNKDFLNSFTDHGVKLKTFWGMVIGSQMAQNQEVEKVLDNTGLSEEVIEQDLMNFKKVVESLSRDLFGFRNESIYVNYSNDDRKFDSPLNIPKEEAELLSTQISPVHQKIVWLIRESDEKTHEIIRKFARAIYGDQGR